MLYKLKQYVLNRKTCTHQYCLKTHSCKDYDKHPRNLHVDYLAVKVGCLCSALLCRTLMDAELAAYVARYQPTQ